MRPLTQSAHNKKSFSCFGGHPRHSNGNSHMTLGDRRSERITAGSALGCARGRHPRLGLAVRCGDLALSLKNMPFCTHVFRLIAFDCVLRKGTQSNGSGKQQARICVLCDAFCPTHSAATSQRHAPAPRQRCLFPQNKQPQRQRAASAQSVQRTGTGGEGRKSGGGQQ